MVRARKSPADGRGNSGGARQGTPGQAYGNRSDLQTQKIQTVPGQEYGQQAAQRRAQQAVPMAGAPAVPQPAGGAAPTLQWATPSDTPMLFDATRRPDEPLEHGMPFGPGRGPEVLGGPAMSDVSARLRALYSIHPTPELRELIEQADLAGA